MLSAFSWGEFVQWMLLSVLCYYLIIGMIFYRVEMRRVWSSFTTATVSNKNTQSRPAVEKEITDKEKSIVSGKETIEQATKTKPVKEISEVYIEVEEVIEGAKVKKVPRSELLASLQTILAKHKNSHKDFAEALKEQVQSQLTIYSFQPLTDEELEHLWLN